MTEVIEILLAADPFLPDEKKNPLFLDAMRLAVSFHREHSDFYRAFLDANGFLGDLGVLEALPPLPIGIFKKRVLASVPENEIVKITHSSATSSGTPSTIVIDDVTRMRQRRALARILSVILGRERKPFVILDSRQTLGVAGGELSSRATTIRGLLSFSSQFFFALDDNLDIDETALGDARERIGSGAAVIFGVTAVFYEVLKKYRDSASAKKMWGNLNQPYLLMSGGWKKLAGLNVDQDEFKRDLADFFGTPRARVIDFYGMIEQPGVIYPECAFGFKHIPSYGEIVIRDLKTMRALPAGQDGMLEVMSPLPHSYPGIALLTDDIGRMAGRSGCACGLPGAFFIFVQRAAQAEAKGCGDTLMIPE